jgi:hypothetical protein
MPKVRPGIKKLPFEEWVKSKSPSLDQVGAFCFAGDKMEGQAA